MANERQRQLMQDALDAALTAEALAELRTELDEDSEAAAEYVRLRRVDQMLKTAPYERAPERLAMKIMAKIALSLKPERLSQESSLALALGLALVMLVAVPLLVAALSLLLMAGGDAETLALIIQQIVALLAAVVAMLEAFAQSAKNVVADTQAPALLLALIPITTYWLLRYMYLKQRDDMNRKG